jgi:recombination protein RecA
VAPPFRTAEFDMIYGKGISKSGDLLDVAVARDVVSRSGTYFNYGEVRLGQGRDNARTFLDENPPIFKEIDDKVRALFASERAKAPAHVAADDEEDDGE